VTDAVGAVGSVVVVVGWEIDFFEVVGGGVVTQVPAVIVWPLVVEVVKAA
jgi:hypothetical protein